MSLNETVLDPILSAQDRDELGHLDYLNGRLEALKARGLIAPEVYATVFADSEGRRRAIERSGRYQGALKRSTVLTRTNPSASLEWAKRARDLDPSREEAWNQIVDLASQMGQFDQAIAHCTEATERFPSFRDRLHRLQTEELQRADSEGKEAERTRQQRDIEGARRGTGKSPRGAARPAEAPDGSRAPQERAIALAPSISWANFASAFLQVHAQELLLCLAVLLIVVSSTVGAHLLLGDLLWSAVGKCTLAMAATLLFAAFGAGLVRWGAYRAGRMMLAATLIVVPIHFMLAGEMKLLHQQSAWRLAFLSFEGITLIAMVRWVSGMLAPVAGARFLTAALLLLSVGSAATARGSPTAWEVQFASFQLSPLVFLVAVWVLGARRWEETSEGHRGYVYMVLGLLGFALMACLIRTGGYALRLEAPLYGLPIMLVAIAGVHAARRLVDDEPDARRLALLRLGSYALSGLAFALVLASPPDSDPLFSANTLAVSALGLCLYGAALRVERRPVFLYLTVGALVAARLGAHYFVAGRLHAIEETVRRLLQYPDHLPVAFRSILGLIPSVALAALAVWFTKRWRDQRLARHCHYIGLPLSIVACLASTFDPLAASICLSGYAILFMLAIWLFRVPWVTYLAASAIAAASYFGSTLYSEITLADQAVAAALLGLMFRSVGHELGRRQIGFDYRRPWFLAAMAMTVAGMLGATVPLAATGVASWAGAAAFLLLAMLAFLIHRDRPRAIWAHVAMASFVEFTICGLGLAMGNHSLQSRYLGLLLMADGLIVLSAVEFLRRRQGRSTTAAWESGMLAQVPGFTIVLTLVADGMGIFCVERSWLAGLVFLLGSLPLLWVTRLSRWTPLVYLGLSQAVAGTFVLVSCATGWNLAIWMVGWLAVTGPILGVGFWRAGVALMAKQWSDFYTEPCRRTALALSVGAYVLALVARGLGREGYPLAVGALGLNVLLVMLLATTWRTPRLTYLAVWNFVTAIYLVLFSVGRSDPAMAYVLGLAAVFQAIALASVGLCCRRFFRMATDEWPRPLFHWAVLLTTLAVLLSDQSSLVLALVGLSFLVTIKTLPRTEWLYASVFALVAAIYLRWLGDVSRIELIGCATLAAFVLSGVGILIQRYKRALCERLQLRSLPYEFSVFHSSIALAAVALVLRVNLSATLPVPWSDHLWFTVALSALGLVMLRAYPRREFVHVSLAFLTWTVVAAVAPSFTSVSFLALAGISLALGLSLFERAARPHEHALCARLGVIDAGYSTVVRSWALAFFRLSAGLTIVVMVLELTETMFGPGPVATRMIATEWWALLATLGLTGVFLVMSGNDREGLSLLEPESLVIAIFWLGIASIWWLGVANSPWGGHWVAAGVYFPLVTAAAGLATAHAVRRHADLGSWHDLTWLGDPGFEPSVHLLGNQALILALLAIIFTKGAIEPATTMTLVMSSLTLGVVAQTTGWRATALTGGLAWSAAWGTGGWIVAQRLGHGAYGLQATCASLGALMASFSLLVLAGFWRGDRPPWVGRFLPADDGAPRWRISLAYPVEIAALTSSLVTAIAVLAAGMSTAPDGAWVTVVGVGVILCAALLQILLVSRWQAEWLVYLAQTVMICAYIDYRQAFPRPIVFDAFIFTMLGYLNLGIAEILERARATIYARPARFFSLVLPSLALIEIIGSRNLNELDLFYLLAAGTFYGIACSRLRSKSLGYAAAVLYNAALWVLWARFGWMLSTHPQFFMVPVGLSTLLFAEVNRDELGRSTVNTIRTVGLTIIYLSMALPIWQYERNFGAWVALLMGSLVGIFLGIGLRLQTFLWMGLTTFVLTVFYEMGRMSLDYALAKWAIMLALGIGLVMFVALNEKKRILSGMRLFYDQARLWE
jgi:hypothetical protein